MSKLSMVRKALNKSEVSTLLERLIKQAYARRKAEFPSRRARLGIPVGVFPTPTQWRRHLADMTKALRTRFRAAIATWSTLSEEGRRVLRKMDDDDWKILLLQRLTNRNRANARGLLRELLIKYTDWFDDLVGKAAARVAQSGPPWRAPEVIRSARSGGRELGDYIVATVSGNPRQSGGKKLWINCIVESKSLRNEADISKQFAGDLTRIRRDGITVNGVHYSPDEIRIDDVTPGELDLVAVLPAERGFSGIGRAYERATDVRLHPVHDDHIREIIDRVFEEPLPSAVRSSVPTQ